ncbi:MAG TPA: hypothetical protein VN207_12810 [Ktedonobacteraceae bacterium]|nr:hypothetical protein [Ktedonobacteraceae bacterium]
MNAFFAQVGGIFARLAAEQTKSRAHFAISRDHIDNGTQLGPSFEAGKHYLQIIINEMFLAHQRQWFTTYDPMVFVASSYNYNKQEDETFPLVIGRSMLSKYDQKAPLGMIFQNTPASAMHPYQGGPLTLVIILSQLQYQNNAAKLLEIVEKVSGAIAPTQVLAPYLSVAKTVLDGVETLLNLPQTRPVVGYRVSINPAIGQRLEPTYYVLIDEDSSKILPERFGIRNEQLHYHDDQNNIIPYRAHDFILFSIAQGNRRDDESILPFYPLWESIRDLAARPISDDDYYWKEAKAEFSTLTRSLLNSPDLTSIDSKRLRDQYFEELKQIRQESIRNSHLKPQPHLPQADVELHQMADELDRLN